MKWCPHCGKAIKEPKSKDQLGKRKYFCKVWCDFYMENMNNVKWKWYGKDINLLDNDIDKCSAHDGLLEACMKRFFNDSVSTVVKFTDQAGYSYGVFHSQLEKILNFLRRK